jgi:tRNA U34 2-thiouridine synthase MnmA/TrmU
MIREVLLTEPVWRTGEGAGKHPGAHPGGGPTRALAQVRYRARPVPVTVELRPQALLVTFDEPAEPLAPGQSLVLYDGDRVLGGGIISQ